MVWVKVVKDSICVCLMRCSEHYHLKMLISLLQTLHDIRSDVNSCIYCFFIREVNFQDYIGVISLHIVNAVNQCLIHVKDQYLAH